MVPSDDVAVAGAPAAAPGPTGAPLTRDVILTFGSKIAVIVLQVGASVVVARELGPSGRGVVAVAATLVVLLIQLGSLGIQMANPYFAIRQSHLLERLIANSFWIAAVGGALLVLAGLAARAISPWAFRGLDWTATAVALAAVPAGLLSLYLQSVLLAEGRMLAYNAVEVGQSVLALGALLVVLVGFGFGVTASIAVYTASYWFAALGFTLLMLRHAPPWRSPDLGLARSVILYGLRVYAASMLGFFIVRIDLFLVNGFLGSVPAGLYSVAAALADAMFILPVVIGVNLLPRVAGSSDNETSAVVFRTVTVLQAGLCVVSAVLVWPVVRVLYGPEFASSVGLYLWLLPGVFSLGLITVLSHHFAGRDFPLVLLAAWGFGTALDIVLNVLLLSDGGAKIASIASSVSYAVVLVAYLVVFARQLGSWSALRPSLSEFAAIARPMVARVIPRRG